jgi:hypothetical protein
MVLLIRAFVRAQALINNGADETCQVLPDEVGGMVGSDGVISEFDFHGILR